MRLVRTLFPVLLLLAFAASAQAKPSQIKPPLLMAHYMAWFAAKPVSAEWGWHWTMNHFNPDAQTNGRRMIAAHDYPLLGPYDSGDPDVLECHVLLMKFAGIGGVFVDWFGTDDFLDYGLVQRNTLRLVPFLKKAGLKFAIVYEDGAVPKLMEAGKLPPSQAVAHGQAMMEWMQAHWFTDPSYLSIDGRPVFLSFGSGYYSGAQWGQIFSVLPQPPAFFTESERRAPALGGFDWPQPGKGTLGALQEAARFDTRARQWPQCIPAAFPRFYDMYAEAGVQRSWGRIADQSGKTYRQTLAAARAGGASVVQLVTWNDWGEGTQIEPSAEVGYRDLGGNAVCPSRFAVHGAGLAPAGHIVRFAKEVCVQSDHSGQTQSRFRSAVRRPPAGSPQANDAAGKTASGPFSRDRV